jgi:hypothetical protein
MVSLEKGGVIVGENFGGAKPQGDFGVLENQKIEQPIHVEQQPVEAHTLPEVILLVPNNEFPVKINIPEPVEEAPVPTEDVTQFVPEVENKPKLNATKTELREAQKQNIVSTKASSEVVSNLEMMVYRADHNPEFNAGEKRGKKTAILNLKYEIEDLQDPDLVVGKILENNKLTDEEKKELVAIVKGDVVAEKVDADESTVIETPTIQENVIDSVILPDATHVGDVSVSVESGVLPGAEPVVTETPEPNLSKIETLSEDQLRENLAQAREVFAGESIKYKNSLREKKGAFRKVMTDLGFPGRQMPEIDKSPEFLQAEKNYIEAKKNLRVQLQDVLYKEKRDEGNKIFDTIPTDKPISEADHVRLNELTDKFIGKYTALNIREAEDEYAKFQRKIIESTPQLEKGIITKAFDKWARLPLPVRVALSATLITGLSVAFGTVGTASALGVGGYRVVRGVLGGGASQIAGKYVDSVQKKKSKERKEEAMEDYAGEFDIDKFEEREKELMQFFEGEENQKKRDRLKKAGIMMGFGAGVSVGLGELHQAVSHMDIAPSGGSAHMDSVGGSKDISQLRSPIKTFDGIKAPSNAVEPIRVELSSKGYIDTFAKLQQDLAEKYPNVKTTPPQVAEILDSTPEKLAIKFGFYKPSSEFESAFGMKGDHLVFDKTGNLVLENAHGAQTIFDAKAGVVHEYSGKMFDAETGKISADVAHVDHPVVEAPLKTMIPTPSVSEVISEQVPQESVAEAVVNGATSTEYPDNVNESTKIFNYSGSDTLLDTAVIASSVLPDTKPEAPKEASSSDALFVFDGKPVAEVPKDFTPSDLASGKLPMNDLYQFGKEKPAREAKRQYSMMFEKMVTEWPQGTVDYRLPIEYMGGYMQVLQKGENVTVLLNGAKIGSGTILSGVPNIQYDGPRAKGMFGVKNDYELAFDKALETVKSKINMFVKTKTI